ncbi:hypothetical protein LNN31_06100 [Acetobacterium wieringae]|uniref:Uncharacterized protein n=1 Tax=Acetobacterium wieringae TaxID=52694 RepID=A0ABY6HKG7_9FIRM|nr:hypothetical protein [Acetobacterium wieringae]MEA4807613.1 hypothetical protein [Acetobacterium wieringae]UYO63986.1 hypothetical protein LNN31_06100 [Acetobacterium wieringae]
MKHEHHKHTHHDHSGEPCSCGHDHSEHHQQHPQQEELCTCGHDHGEQHQHHPQPEETGACGHDHTKHKDHDHHQHQHPKPSHDDLSITHHENAVIVSAEREISGDYQLIKDALVLCLKELADWVESQDGLVGHIKAHLTEKGKSAMLSTTGDTVQIKEAHHPAVILNLAVIVFVADETALANQVAAMLEKLS